MESSIAVFLKRWTASELPPTFLRAGSTEACLETKHLSFHAPQGFPGHGVLGTGAALGSYRHL